MGTVLKCGRIRRLGRRGNFTAEYAKSLGFVADTDFADIIRAFMEDEHVSALAEG